MKTWFITGACRSDRVVATARKLADVADLFPGFGCVWAEAALTRGDQVAATARKSSDVGELVERFGDAALPLVLDVTAASRAKIQVRRSRNSL